MATRPAASQLSVLFLVPFFLISVQFGSAGETQLITAEPGDNAVLPCEAPEKKPVIIVEWRRSDMGESDHVALYRSGGFDDEGQNPSYKDRVDLQDREMKNGNVSLVLKNVTTDDNGKYECRVAKNKRRKRSHLDTEPIKTVTLDVSAPGNKEGKKDGGNNTGLIVGVSVLVPVVVVALLAVVVFLRYKKLRRSPQEQNQPPAAKAELQAMNVENHPEFETLISSRTNFQH